MDDLVPHFKQTLDFKIKESAVKQEREKNQEVVRAVLRCILAVEGLGGGMCFLFATSFLFLALMAGV